MLSEWEELRSLERQAQTMRKGYEPWKAASVEERAAELRERIEYYDELHQVMIENSSDSVKAGVIWAEITRQADDSLSRCSTFLSVLFSKELITPSQFIHFQGQLRFIPYVTRSARQVEEEEIKRINDTFDDILKAVGKEHRSEGLAEYNKLEGFRTMEKLKDWTKKLVELGLLPKSYVFGLKVGGAIQKMIDTFSDKELKAGANK